MATTVTYLCPHCSSDINCQYWLPATSKESICRSCKGKVIRSGASIRDDWKSSVFMLGYLPLALTISLVAFANSPKLGFAALFMGFIFALVPGVIGLSLIGWIIGLFVSILAPEPQVTRYYPTEDDGRAMNAALLQGQRWKQKWN